MDFHHKHKLDLGIHYSQLDSSNYTDNLEIMSEIIFMRLIDSQTVYAIIQKSSTVNETVTVGTR